MKTYTFTLPKNNKANNYKNALMERVITAYPWLTIESKMDYPYSEYGVEHAKGGDMITLGISKKHNISWLPEECKDCPFKCLNGVTNFNLETEFFNAMTALDAYAKAHCPKDYDFETEFGVPVKIFDNFIQVGYDIIPIKTGSLNYLKDQKTKKIVIDITIKLKKHGLF